MCQKQESIPFKYTINKYVTKELRQEICKELSINESTYYRKSKAKINDSNGFEVCQMYLIAAILGKELHELINDEAIKVSANKTTNHA